MSELPEWLEDVVPIETYRNGQNHIVPIKTHDAKEAALAGAQAAVREIERVGIATETAAGNLFLVIPFDVWQRIKQQVETKKE